MKKVIAQFKQRKNVSNKEICFIIFLCLSLCLHLILWLIPFQSVRDILFTVIIFHLFHFSIVFLSELTVGNNTLFLNVVKAVWSSCLHQTRPSHKRIKEKRCQPYSLECRWRLIAEKWSSWKQTVQTSLQELAMDELRQVQYINGNDLTCLLLACYPAGDQLVLVRTSSGCFYFLSTGPFSPLTVS